MTTDRARAMDCLVRMLQVAVDNEDTDQRSFSRTASQKRDVDWRLVDHLAQAHGIAPLVHRTLRDAEDSQVPADVRASLADATRNTTRHNLRLTGELHEVLSLFQERGITAVPFKGPVLAADAYGDVGRRQFNDIDLLVPTPGIGKAASVLQERGYSVRFGSRQVKTLSPVQRRVLFTSNNAIDFVKDDFRIEVHWQVLPAKFGGKLSAGDLCARAERATVAGTRLPVLPRPEHLAVVCIHGSKHAWPLLKWVTDVVMLGKLITQDEWLRVYQFAETHHCQRPFLVGVAVAELLLGMPVPSALQREMQADNSVGRLARDACHRLRQETISEPETPLDRFDRTRLHLRLHRRYRDKWRHLLAVGVHPKPADVNAVSLPGWSFPAYYPLRPIRIVTGLIDGVLTEKMVVRSSQD